VDNLNKARNAPDREKLSFTEADVLHIELPNKPGGLASLAGKLADKDINITLVHQTTVKGSSRASVVLAVPDLEKAARVRELSLVASPFGQQGQVSWTRSTRIW